MIDVQPNDRILFLAMPDPPLVHQLAAKAALLVVMGDEEEVRLARREMRDLENVMLTPATPDEIPWRDGFFTTVVDQVCRWEQPKKVAAEVARVLAPGGLVCVVDTEITRSTLLGSGFREVSAGGSMLIARVG